MPSYERYDNGDASSDHNSSPTHKANRDFSSQYDLRDYLSSSRSKEMERGEGRDRRVRDRDDERRHRDHRCGRKEGRRNGDYDDGYDHTRDYERHSDRGSKRRHSDSCRSRSRSRSRSHRSRSRSRSHRSKSRSLSTSNSKRISRFDVGPPPGSVVLNGVIATAGPIMQPFVTALPMMSVQATRHARRVYVGGLSPTANEQSVATFFSQVMSKIGGNTAGPGDAVINVYINHDKKFAFVEMRSVEEASNAMALNGIIFEGAPVKVKRPTDYNPTLAAALGPSYPNPNLNLAAVGMSSGSAGVPEGPDRIFVGGLPYYFTEEQIRELLESFGKLRGFDLVKDRETGNSKGYAFCVYDNVSVTDIACGALNGLTLGDKTLTVRRANQGASQPNPEQENILLHAKQQVAFQKMLLQGGTGALPTKVVCLTHAVSADELIDDEEYENTMEDMREGARYGTLVNVVIPRPKANGELSPGVGKVFLEYADIDGASKAKAGLDGRKFGENQVVASFYPEDKFAHGDYNEMLDTTCSLCEV